MANSAAEYFGSIAESYDSLIHRAVPRYDEMLERLVAYLPTAPEHAMELGCGSGNLSLRLATHWPSTSCVFVDASAEMVELTSSRLAATHPAVAHHARFLTTRFEELSAEPQSLDVITSSISLHHVRDMHAFYVTLHRALRREGQLVYADQFRGTPEATHAVNWNRWLSYCREAGNCSETELASLVEHAETHDHYIPLAEHFRLLLAAGFSNVDCVWRDGMWGIITATA